MNRVIGQDQPSGAPLPMRFRLDARSNDQANPDTTRDSADLQQNNDVGVEAEQAQEQEQEQDVQWTVDFEATGSTTGETVRNITMSGATIGDVASRTRARAGASQSDSNVPVKLTMHETAKTQPHRDTQYQLLLPL